MYESKQHHSTTYSIEHGHQLISGDSESSGSLPPQAALGTLRNRYAGEVVEGTSNPCKKGEDACFSHDKKRSRRAERFELQRTSAKLLGHQRVAHCHWTAQANHVELLRRNTDARIEGTQTCGSVWACPVCSARISEVRRQELRTLEAWAGSPRRRVQVVMMTLTARHRRKGLAKLLDQLGGAKKRIQNRAAWKNLRNSGQLVGSVSIREATHGKNGWHPHYHVVMIIDAATEKQALDLLEPLRKVWIACLRKEGLTGTRERAFHLSTGDTLAAYLAKHGRDDAVRASAKDERNEAWGVAEEATLSRAKKADGENRTPWQILRDARDGDAAAEKLWIEYGNAMWGRRQQVWSDGLKLRVGVIEIDDKEAAKVDAYTEDSDELLASWSRDGWNRVRHLRADLLDAAEVGGSEAVQTVLDGIGHGAEPVDISRPPPPRPGGLAERLLLMTHIDYQQRKSEAKARAAT